MKVFYRTFLTTGKARLHSFWSWRTPKFRCVQISITLTKSRPFSLLPNFNITLVSELYRQLMLQSVRRIRECLIGVGGWVVGRGSLVVGRGSLTLTLFFFLINDWKFSKQTRPKT